MAPQLDYGSEPQLLRVGESVAFAPQAVFAGAALQVRPDLPAGLVFDAATGAVSGAPTEVVPRNTYTVDGTVEGRMLQATLDLAVGVALPAEIAVLEPGYTAERVAVLAQPPAKFAIAPDGRLFVGELLTGSIRVIGVDGTLQAQPFAQVSVANGGHRGLLGIALSPDFANDARVFAMAVVPDGPGDAVRAQVLRWIDGGGTGTDLVVLVDGLPASGINNGGALAFDADGMLLVSVGDNEDPFRAQDDQDLAGKILRFDPEDGSVPADNPDPLSPVFCKGLRNVFALACHPATGGLFGADNGPATDDELLLLQGGRNYEWGANGETFGALTGPVLRHWPDVVVPTGLAFRGPVSVGDRWPAAHASSLFGSFYDEEIVERFAVSGAAATDIDDESVFLRFAIQSNQNKPLDLQFDPEGRLLVLTQTAIFRIARID